MGDNAADRQMKTTVIQQRMARAEQERYEHEVACEEARACVDELGDAVVSGIIEGHSRELVMIQKRKRTLNQLLDGLENQEGTA